MAYEEILTSITRTASGTIAQYTAVAIGGTDAAPTCTNPAGETDPLIIGVAQNGAASGEEVTIAVAGITKMVAGETFATHGLKVGASSNGKAAIPATTEVVIGINMTDGAVDKYMSVLLGRTNAPLA